MSQSHHGLRQQRGLSLIEVLVAMLVFSIGLLGTAQLLAQQQRLGQESSHRAMATIMAEDLLERAKLDPERRQHFVGTFDTGAGQQDAAPAALRQWMTAWTGRSALPAPKVCVSASSGDIPDSVDVQVTLVWYSRIGLTAPAQLPTCVSERGDDNHQRWVMLSAWVGA
ncbi:type IV pilus modification protein PilV [Salinicola endophyticus]|uniref:Type IV pilus modification protein PilV n=1 Tax=Salinicola endophyticus TaxID=1949083 RepID=A0ABY8FJW0_9GAMM|nr:MULTISPECIES: type IV pilus modification protein PilV [Salinicola]WFF40886.1 type IV pilus modification protein PilV [Salinicola endophyticus]